MYDSTLQNVASSECSVPVTFIQSKGRDTLVALEDLLSREYITFSSPISEVDPSSIEKPYIETKTETVIKTLPKKDFYTRIADIANKLLRNEEPFKRLDRVQMENFLKFVEGNISPEQIDIISDEELLSRVEKALGIELMCGLLNDLKEEQIASFESSIKRRDLFK
jgi:hypothetical protein